MLTHCLDLIDQAYAAIAPLQTSDPALYEALSEHINIESISFRYLLLQLYGTNYSDADLQAMRRSFVSDVQKIGLTRMNASNTIAADVFAGWGM